MWVIRRSRGIISSGSSKVRVDTFRITCVNSTYSACPSYPALLVVPTSVTDEGLMKIARCHRQNRFPVVTWRHPITKALLIRGSSFHGRGVMGMLKGHQHQSSSGGGFSNFLHIVLALE
jgi:myotubularin-related protein 5/13